MTTDVKWGVLDNEEEIKNELAKLAKKSVESFVFEHMTSGFTDNVFLATVKTRTRSSEYIVKQYIKDWHSRESNFYEEVLSKTPSLGAPAVLFSGDNFIILEYLSGKPLLADNLSLLKDWIINKHTLFVGSNNLDWYEETLKTKIHYLVEKPINSLKLFAQSKFINDRQKDLIFKALELPDYYTSLIKNDLARQQTLEHGDLELQNIFVSTNNCLRIIDWVNARKGSGLFDINQFFETAEELKVELNKDSLINEFATKLNILNLKESLDEVRILMLLNKINFYICKLLNGESRSPSKNKLVIELLAKYLDELFNQFKENPGNGITFS